jgi:REP-associated tyrosine transposase
MPQSLSKVIVHIIFSTKDREPWLGLQVRPRMHAYLATVCRDLGAEVVRVGGVADHVHIVTTLPRTASHAELIEWVKENVLESHCRALLRLSPVAGRGLR